MSDTAKDADEAEEREAMRRGIEDIVLKQAAKEADCEHDWETLPNGATRCRSCRKIGGV